MFSNKTFCALPWASIQINPSGNFKICCFSGNDGNHGVGKDENGNVMNILTHSIEDALNSDLHKQLRLAQSRNERHPVCQVCWKKEDANFQQIKAGMDFDHSESPLSHRIVRTFTHMSEFEDGITTESAPSVMQADGSIDHYPILLDIRFSNLCNAKCIQCEPQYSTLWYSDHIALTGSNKFNVGPKQYTITQEGNKYVTNMVRWHDDPRWWEQFERIKGRLRRVYITGGEPFVQPSHDEFLDRLIASGHSKNITLEYDTNLTAINSKIIERLSKFQAVRFSVSVDDTEKRYELIRYPSSWKTLLKNLEVVSKMDNVATSKITTCIGIPTVFAPIRLAETFVPLGYDKFPKRLLRSPDVYDLAYLPDEAKIQVIAKYQEADIPEKYKITTIGYLKNNLQKHSYQTCIERMDRFKTRMDKLDELRGTDWKDTMPDVAELLHKHINI